MLYRFAVEYGNLFEEAFRQIIVHIVFLSYEKHGLNMSRLPTLPAGKETARPTTS